MDILNWLYLQKAKLIKKTISNPTTDLVVLGADATFAKRGDQYQTYGMTVEDFANNLKPYKIYTALLNQTGTDAPVATVLENTIGDIWFTYNDVGGYIANSNGLFTSNKSIGIFMPNQYVESPQDLYNFQIYATDSNQFALNTFYNYNLQDGILNGYAQTSIEIRVYN